MTDKLINDELQISHDEHTHPHSHEHTHAHESEEHSHSHSHAHSHTHTHDPQTKKRQINRISRVIGHLEHIKRMIENDEDCSDVLVQIASTRSALNGLGKSIINEHITHCISHALEEGDTAAVEEFQEAIQKFL